MDLHAAQIQGFFDIPVDHLYGAPLLAKYFKKKMDENWVVVSPDVGSVGRARNFASRVDASLAIVDKRRPKANAIEVMNVIGDVKDKTCIMVDDMIDTAGTICQGAEALMKFGAKEVYACCTHGVLSGPAIERLTSSPIKKLYILNTINLPQEKKHEMFEEISVADIFAKSIQCIFADEPLSKLYE
jgi:ribose-phosphate pyrophosphokinase